MTPGFGRIGIGVIIRVTVRYTFNFRINFHLTSVQIFEKFEHYKALYKMVPLWKFHLSRRVDAQWAKSKKQKSSL
jgi:hypothetical protein